MKYKVVTRHVDGSRTRRFKSLAGAVKAFEDHLGYPIQNVIEEKFWHLVEQGKPLPAIEQIRVLDAVNEIGGTICLARLDDDEDDRMDAQAQAFGERF